jgi:hypothetical protein
VHSDGRRAIFSRLVAFDTSWRPHVTAIVDRVELRMGMTPDAPACVVKLVPERLHCAHERLVPIATDAPHRHLTFFDAIAGPGIMLCNECHGPASGRAPANTTALAEWTFGDLEALPRVTDREPAQLAAASLTAQRLQALAR